MFSMNHKSLERYWWVYWLISVLSMSVYWYLDSRPLVDLGRYYQSISDWWLWIERPTIQMFVGLLSQLGGWLNVLLAMGIWLVNDPEIVFMSYAVITSGLFWWGLRDAPIWTGIFLLMQPIWQVMWRTHWIHALETSMILIIWQSWRTERITYWTGILTMLVVWLRPSALIWLGLFLIWDCVRDTNSPSHHILIGMVVGCLFISPQLSQYASGKLAVPRIEWSVLDQIGRHGGWIPTLIMVLTVVWAHQIKNRDWIPLIWIGTGLALSLSFGVGIDNFPLVFTGLSLLAGRVFVFKSIGGVVVALAAIVHVLPFTEGVPSQARYFFHSNTIEDTPYDFQRPIRNVNGFIDPISVQSVLKDLCKDNKPHCLVVTTGTLFHPHRESQGRLALLSTELRHIRVEKAELWFRRNEQLKFVNVAISQNCEANKNWLPKFRRFASEFESHLQNWKTVDTIAIEDCKWRFIVPSQ